MPKHELAKLGPEPGLEPEAPLAITPSLLEQPSYEAFVKSVQLYSEPDTGVSATTGEYDASRAGIGGMILLREKNHPHWVTVGTDQSIRIMAPTQLHHEIDRDTGVTTAGIVTIPIPPVVGELRGKSITLTPEGASFAGHQFARFDEWGNLVLQGVEVRKARRVPLLYTASMPKLTSVLQAHHIATVSGMKS